VTQVTFDRGECLVGIDHARRIEHPPVGRTLRIGGVHVHKKEVEGRSPVEVLS
jgi:hypothetical protein